MILLVFIASIEGLVVFLVIVLLSALSNWIKQKKEFEQQRRRIPATQPREKPPGPREPEKPVPPPVLDLEEQLRRLLDETLPDREAVPEPSPPPPDLTKQPSVPPKLVPQTPSKEPAKPEPATAAIPQPPKEKPPVPSQVLARSPSPMPAREARPEPDRSSTAASVELAKLEASAAAYKRAAELAAQTAARLEEIARLGARGAATDSMASVKGLSPDILQVRAMLANPRSAAQAIIASQILGPPKCLEEAPDAFWVNETF